MSVPEEALVRRASPPDNPVHAEIARLERELAGARGELVGVREALGGSARRVRASCPVPIPAPPATSETKHFRPGKEARPQQIARCSATARANKAPLEQLVVWRNEDKPATVRECLSMTPAGLRPRSVPVP